MFNQENNCWKGEIKNGEKWKGKGAFIWKDNKENNWECEGKFMNIY